MKETKKRVAVNWLTKIIICLCNDKQQPTINQKKKKTIINVFELFGIIEKPSE